MNEVVAADGETVAVATHLPYGQVGVRHLATGSDGCGTTVNGVHAIGCHVVRQTAGTADTADDGCVGRRYANLGHCLVETGQEEVVTTPGTPTRLSLLIIIKRICHNTWILFSI